MQKARVDVRRFITRLTLFALTVLIAAALSDGCRESRPPKSGGKTRPTSAPASPTNTNANLPMGNPSRAIHDPSNKDNYLIENRYFALSYNSSEGRPNWVSWRLTAGDIGDAPRVSFHPDQDLPQGFQVVLPSDYTGSGFDRGHMCPHQDRSANEAMSESTFVMTNIVPQSPPLNQQPWEELESYCRELAEHGHVLYIIDGPYGAGGTGRDGPASTIGRQNVVTVPSKCWKVIIVLNAGPGDDLQKVTSATRLIAVIMPNDMNVDADWSDYRTSVADVEQLTGYTFFNRVPTDIMGPLKKKVDNIPIEQSEPWY